MHAPPTGSDRHIAGYGGPAGTEHVWQTEAAGSKEIMSIVRGVP
jgi:hypothetical protein